MILEQQSENISAVLQESTNCKLYWKGGWEKSREKKKSVEIVSVRFTESLIYHYVTFYI